MRPAGGHRTPLRTPSNVLDFFLILIQLILPLFKQKKDILLSYICQLFHGTTELSTTKTRYFSRTCLEFAPKYKIILALLTGNVKGLSALQVL